MGEMIVLDERTSHLRLAIDLISDKWRIAILHQLSDGPRRTAHLQKALDDVAPKVLTQTLRGLERDGLVQRKAHAVAPPRVEYRLTDMARHLLEALDDLCCWSETYGCEALLARTSYDAQVHSRATLSGSESRDHATRDGRPIAAILQSRFGVRPIPVNSSDARLRQATSA